MAQSVADQEYRNMMTPEEALGHLAERGIPIDAAKAEIASRLLSGRVQGVAQRAFVVTIRGEQTNDCMRISRAAWMGVDIPPGFWSGDDLKLPRTGDVFAAVLGSLYNGSMTCVGVRFDRLGIDILVEDHRRRTLPKPSPAAKISQAPTPIVPLKISAPMGIGSPEAIQSIVEASRVQSHLDIRPNEDVSEDFLRRTAPELFKPLGVAHQPRRRENPMTVQEIKAWHRGLSKAEKTLGVTALWARAVEDNPGRHIPRKLVEPFGAKRGTGHRAMKQSSR